MPSEHFTTSMYIYIIQFSTVLHCNKSNKFLPKGQKLSHEERDRCLGRASGPELHRQNTEHFVRQRKKQKDARERLLQTNDYTSQLQDKAPLLTLWLY